MNGSSKLLCGLLMSCLCFGATGSKEELSIIQSPANSITVNEGDSAQITCCWNKVNHSVKTVWYKNEKRVAAEKQQHKEDCSILYITKITMNDTGDYFCKLYQDIPYLLEFEGNRTTIIVKEGQVSTYTTTTANVNSVSLSTATAATASSAPSHKSPDPPLTLPLSLAAAIGLLTLCLAFSMCKMRNSCKNSERMVIHQMTHSEGEENENMEVEEISTNSSRGSQQWYQVPVYWSYFDVQTGEEQCQPE
ncbi:uncharacterized protein LOC127430992 [Myxocyprinus asiaticus]|uniref:uncharacterized protein LOC127430992 n=1 Tax=Myxocyprinus asiaticus TaxID=70543 RepID=UPI0022221DC7|nr:uncharacterized protein LOC127430992 [Myxocyprinus asiaticus]